MSSRHDQVVGRRRALQQSRGSPSPVNSAVEQAELAALVPGREAICRHLFGEPRRLSSDVAQLLRDLGLALLRRVELGRVVVATGAASSFSRSSGCAPSSSVSGSADAGGGRRDGRIAAKDGDQQDSATPASCELDSHMVANPFRPPPTGLADGFGPGTSPTASRGFTPGYLVPRLTEGDSAVTAVGAQVAPWGRRSGGQPTRRTAEARLHRRMSRLQIRTDMRLDQTRQRLITCGRIAIVGASPMTEP